MEIFNKNKDHNRHRKKRISASTLILLLVLAVGTAIMAYPTASDWWNRSHAYKAITDYSAQVESLGQDEINAMFEAADKYNKKLANGTDFALDETEFEEYMGLLNITGTGIMGYVQIPSINVNMPVYHTVEEDVLQTAVGHIPGTSLPIGGERTHAVISGHRGLPSAKLFTDLNKLSEGDVFTMTILDRVFTYQIDQIRIVLPGEVEELAIQPGRDYMTLVTCTPYGVNSHRMLVRGSRVANAAAAVQVKTEASRIPGYVMMPFIAMPLLLLALLAMFISGRVAGRIRSKEHALELLRTEGFDDDEYNIKKEDGTDENEEQI